MKIIWVVGSAIILLGGVTTFVWYRAHRKKTQKIPNEEDKVIGMILGTAIGDAKGIPYENKSYERIRELGTINEIYSKCKNHLYIPDGFPPGKWTDDTQLSLAMMNSIISTGGIQLTAIAEEHVKAYQETTDGWGGTRDAVHRLLMKTHTCLHSGNEKATGNGVVMKMAPVAFYYSRQRDYPQQKKNQEIEWITRMSHNNSLSVVAALFHVTMLEIIFRGAPGDLDTVPQRKKFLKDAIACAHQCENQLADKEEWKDKLLSYRLNQLLKCLEGGDGEITTTDLIEISNGGTFFVNDSLTMVYGILVHRKPCFESILEAAFIGGDTDSNAAMIGAIVGGLKGRHILPQKYLDPLYKCHQIIEVAEKFAAILSGKS